MKTEFLNFNTQTDAAPPRRMEETIRLCVGVMREQRMTIAEERTGFFGYLSEIFRYEGLPIFGLQALTLLVTCAGISFFQDIPEIVPVFVPLFALAAAPILFRGQNHGMCELEAATRASGAQITLAKLVLVGAADLVCMTILLCVKMFLQGSHEGIWQMILYVLVPYLICMILLLRLFRLRKRESFFIYTTLTLGSCVGWGFAARLIPRLYETSAIGFWIIAFLLFTVFFGKELAYLITMRKEGKMYGIIA